MQMCNPPALLEPLLIALQACGLCNTQKHNAQPKRPREHTRSDTEVILLLAKERTRVSSSPHVPSRLIAAAYPSKDSPRKGAKSSECSLHVATFSMRSFKNRLAMTIYVHRTCERAF